MSISRSRAPPPASPDLSVGLVGAWAHPRHTAVALSARGPRSLRVSALTGHLEGLRGRDAKASPGLSTADHPSCSKQGAFSVRTHGHATPGVTTWRHVHLQCLLFNWMVS